jgi:ADP-ribose pyrophosphatase YjhB (NUDIX family)
MSREMFGHLFRHPGWGGLRGKLFHRYFLMRRAMTLGVRAMLLDRGAGTIFLVRHTYVPGWHLPGGGVELGQTMAEAVARECLEEGNIVFAATPALQSIHLNISATRRDHVGFYVVEAFHQTEPKRPDREVAEAGFFPIDRLPEGVTGGTQRRIDEVLGGTAPDPYW